jgi:hypothetical protein
MSVIQPERINMKRLLSIIAVTLLSIISLADQLTISTITTESKYVPVPAYYVSVQTNWSTYEICTTGTARIVTNHPVYHIETDTNWYQYVFYTTTTGSASTNYVCTAASAP